MSTSLHNTMKISYFLITIHFNFLTIRKEPCGSTHMNIFKEKVCFIIFTVTSSSAQDRS